MLTGEIRSQIDSIWDVSGPAASRTRLSHRADHLPALHQASGRHADPARSTRPPALGKPMERRIFPRARMPAGRPYEDMRWSRFKNLEPREMFDIVGRARLPLPAHPGRRRRHLRRTT